jgi:hypothetical protein
METMFVYASRIKLRFNSPRGLLTVEDLWDLPLQSTSGKANLDDIAKALFKKLQETEVSFVKPEGTAADDKSEVLRTQVALDIVKHIIAVKIAERDEAAAATRNRQRKQHILGIIAQKENEALLGSSLDDLRKMLDEIK